MARGNCVFDLEISVSQWEVVNIQVSGLQGFFIQNALGSHNLVYFIELIFIWLKD